MALAQRLSSLSGLKAVRQSIQAIPAAPLGITARFTPILLTSITLPSICIPIPGLMSDIWEGILKAVPKKKTSHMKKRHRQLAGKALKDVNAVNSCSGCGKPKKAHTLCPYCVADIKESWKQAAKQATKTSAEGSAS